MTRANHWCREDFLRRHDEARQSGKPMKPPVNRVLLIEEQAGRCLAARAATPSGLSRQEASSCQHHIAIAGGTQ